MGVERAEFESILTAAREAAPWAWTRLYRALAPQLLGYLRSRGAVEPEDLLGEVWIHVARSLASFTGDYDGFRSWMFMIAHHRLVDERRRRGRRPIVHDSGTDDLLADTLHPGDEVAELLELDGLVAILEDLPETQQSVVLLRVIADLSVDQTALVLGISEAAVKSAQYRAVKKLRETLSQSATNLAASAVTEM